MQFTISEIYAAIAALTLALFKYEIQSLWQSFSIWLTQFYKAREGTTIQIRDPASGQWEDIYIKDYRLSPFDRARRGILVRYSNNYEGWIPFKTWGELLKRSSCI